MDAPFDRGEIDRASLDATERLRARLSSQPVSTTAPRRGGNFAWIVAGGLFLFSAGMIINPWFEANVRNRLPFVAQEAPAVPAVDPAVKALQARLAQLEGRVGEGKSGGTDRMPVERLARTEAKIETSTDQIARESDRIDRLTSDVAGLTVRLDADRGRTDAATAAAFVAANHAEAMLTLVLVRRAIESGRSFGALDAALHRSFEARYPDAVKAVAAVGAAPVTVARLRREFDALLPSIGVRSVAPARQSWWEVLSAKISSTVTKPMVNATSGPAERASAALARGDIVAAASELRRLPIPRPPAVSAWLDSVERLRAGMQGLSTLETASLLGSPEPVAAVPAPVATGAKSG